MRPRSKTNSRPGENIELRRQYLAENLFCEMSPFLAPLGFDAVPGLRKQETATDPHHIWGGAGRRHDNRSNLLAVCRPVHLWSHKYLIDSRVLGIAIKLRKGELNEEEFRKASGKDSVKGWLEIVKPQYPAIESLRVQLIERL